MDIVNMNLLQAKTALWRLAKAGGLLELSVDDAVLEAEGFKYPTSLVGMIQDFQDEIMYSISLNIKHSGSEVSMELCCFALNKKVLLTCSRDVDHEFCEMMLGDLIGMMRLLIFDKEQS